MGIALSHVLTIAVDVVAKEMPTRQGTWVLAEYMLHSVNLSHVLTIAVDVV